MSFAGDAEFSPNLSEIPGIQIKSSEAEKKPNIFQKAKKLITPRKEYDINDISNQAMCVKKVSQKLLKYKNKASYKIYSLIPLFLIIFIVSFILLVYFKGNNSIYMSSNLTDIADLINTKNNLINSKNLLNPVINNAEIEDLNKQINDTAKLIDISIEKDKTYVYNDAISDKSIDLCNGLIASTLMIFIGSASYKYIKLKRDEEKKEPSCNM